MSKVYKLELPRADGQDRASAVRREALHANTLLIPSGDEAIDFLRTHHDVDCVFTDVRMPDKADGLALARYIQAECPQIKGVMTSGNLGPGERIADFVKPYDCSQISDFIGSLLAQRSAS